MVLLSIVCKFLINKLILIGIIDYEIKNKNTNSSIIENSFLLVGYPGEKRENLTDRLEKYRTISQYLPDPRDFLPITIMPTDKVYIAAITADNVVNNREIILTVTPYGISI